MLPARIVHADLYREGGIRHTLVESALCGDVKVALW